ncbi:hypothetical protein SBDP1_540005 [Syntrophobacter sp. SbD1]|nr:hypothetical protein SBDP1_540005 [Syntrophobacter sp. SbD1]
MFTFDNSAPLCSLGLGNYEKFMETNQPSVVRKSFLAATDYRALITDH